MLSKCLNPQCSATFQYLNQGRLFRVDFNEAERRNSQAGKVKSTMPRRKSSPPIEHFWLCERCAQAMTLELRGAGEVGLIPLDSPVHRAGPVGVRVPHCEYEATAS
jgi:hypothetical protein